MAAFTGGQIAGIEGGLGLIGLAGGIAGSLESMAGAKQKAGDEMAIARLQMQADDERRKAMELSARRSMLQTVRNAQQAKAQALSNATSQGGQFSSGLAGGQATVSGEAGTQLLGTSQALQTGKKLFDIAGLEDAAKIDEASAESKIASGQGMAGIFGAVGKSAMSVGNLMSLI